MYNRCKTESLCSLSKIKSKTGRYNIHGNYFDVIVPNGCTNIRSKFCFNHFRRDTKPPLHMYFYIMELKNALIFHSSIFLAFFTLNLTNINT